MISVRGMSAESPFAYISLALMAIPRPVALISLVPGMLGIRNRHEAWAVWICSGRVTVRIKSLVVTEACYAANVHEKGPSREPDWLTDQSRIDHIRLMVI